MPGYYDGAKYLRQMMIGGSLYTPQWYISLAKGGGDPYDEPVSSWEVPGTATLLTTTWVDDPINASQSYISTITNEQTVNIVVPNNATMTYWVIRDGLSSNVWQFIGRFNNYPLSVAAGDIVRFSPGALKISFTT